MNYADLTGRPVPPGRTVRTLTYPALTGPLPPWLAVPSGTGSFVDPVASLGHYRVSGEGTLRLWTTPVDVRHPTVAWMSFTVAGAHCDATTGINPGIGLKSDAGDAGVGIFHMESDLTAKLRLLGAGQADIPINYQWSGAELTRRRDLTIAIGAADRSVWLLEGDQVMHHGVYPDLRLGVLRGVYDATTTGTHEIRALQVELGTATN